MTLLANAGIYLVLDVNSPRIGESLNRYEPWTTYNPYYLEHVLRVVHQFAGYNNTLGFFAGNEVVNNEVSARESPHYIKAIIRDMHKYMELHSTRQVPIGYSAADDLRYRISLAKYLECGEEGTHVDFYGVNSYQWCGSQTFQTSGYDILVRDYTDYALPIFFSEYGCNAVTPRVFQEVEALYSLQMTNVFSGGLIYEYAQEINSYGLVEIAQDGSAHTLMDYDTLQHQYQSLKVYYDYSNEKQPIRPVKCKTNYAHLGSDRKIPDSPIKEILQQGFAIPQGKFVDVKTNASTFKVFDSKNNEITNRQIQRVLDLTAPALKTSKYRPIKEYVRLPLPEKVNSISKTVSDVGTKVSSRNLLPSLAPTVSPTKGSNLKHKLLGNKQANSNSSPPLFFSKSSLKLLLGSIALGGPLIGLSWFGFI